MEDLTGKQLGPYQIVSPLGEGGMAAVYKAYQPSMDRYVALKVLPRHFASDPEFVNRFSQEARVIANLQHPHILPVHDFGESDGYTYLAMRFIEGGTLSDWLKEKRPAVAGKNSPYHNAGWRGVGLCPCSRRCSSGHKTRQYSG